MSYSFEYIDIILLAMIAGFIFLRLRGILGKKSGYEDEMASSFPHDFSKEPLQKNPKNMEFDDEAKNNFIKGAKIAYENGNKAEISCFNDPYVLGNVDSLTSGIVTIKYGPAYYVFSEECHQITLVTVMIAKSYSGGTAC